MPFGSFTGTVQLRFSPGGTFECAFDLRGTAEDRGVVQLFDLEWAPDPPELLVADTINSRIVVLDPETGEEKRSVTGFTP